MSCLSGKTAHEHSYIREMMFSSFTVNCTTELDPMTEGMLKMMGVSAEIERNMIRQRVKSGISNTRSKGKLIGRPRLTYKKYQTNHEKPGVIPRRTYQ